MRTQATRVFAAAPVIWLVLFLSFVLRARQRLGEWPAQHLIDPKDLDPYPLHYALVLCTLPTAFVCALFALVRGIMAADSRSVVLASMGIAAVLWVLVADPGGSVMWLSD